MKESGANFAAVSVVRSSSWMSAAVLHLGRIMTFCWSRSASCNIRPMLPRRSSKLRLGLKRRGSPSRLVSVTSNAVTPTEAKASSMAIA